MFLQQLRNCVCLRAYEEGHDGCSLKVPPSTQLYITPIMGHSIVNWSLGFLPAGSSIPTESADMGGICLPLPTPRTHPGMGASCLRRAFEIEVLLGEDALSLAPAPNGIPHTGVIEQGIWAGIMSVRERAAA